MKDTSIIVGMASAAVIIGVVIFLNGGGSMSGTQLSAEANNPQSAVAVPFTEVARGTQSVVTTRINYLITSESELNKLWEMIHAAGTPPMVDFETSVVAAVFAGEDSKSSSAVSVAKIEDTDARTVFITLDLCAEGDGANYEIVTMPATSLPLTHEDQIISTNCQS